MATVRLEGPVSFGGFVLDPADARLLGPAGPVRLGRKAFGVLETLVAQPGRLLTKETLFETVWDGTIVSESALTSAVKELRRALGDEIKKPRFIESVYGRGYRFIAPVTNGAVTGTGPAAADAPNGAPPEKASHVPSRRTLLAWGGAAAAVTTAAIVGVPRLRRPAPSPEVEGLIAQARHLMDQNSPEGQYEAMGLLRRVVDLAPGFADGWGLLGMSYAIPAHYRERAEGQILRARAKAAARRALALDPGNGYGELALGLELPIIGHWAERDRRFARALADRPDNDDVLTFVAVILQFNGRSSAALPYYERIRERPLTPAAYSNYIRALWSAGRVEETDQALDDAIALYPTQTTLWFDRWHVLLFGGRADAAFDMAHNPVGRPPTLDAEVVAELMAQAEAVREPGSAKARGTLQRAMQEARNSAGGAQIALRLAGGLGAVDAGFALAEAYYFSRGFAVPDYREPGSATSRDERQTRILFEPETAPLRADPRFETLVAEIGLDAYWRESGLQPDYRLERGQA